MQTLRRERADVGECTDSNRAAKLAAKKADFESTAEQFEAYEAFRHNAPNVLKEIKNIYLTTFNAMMGGFWFISLVLMVDLLSESNWDWALASLSAWEKVAIRAHARSCIFHRDACWAELS